MGEKHFMMDGVTEKDFIKIVAHLQVHPIHGNQPVLKNCNYTVEVGRILMATYNPSEKRILVTTNEANVKKVKELFYHFLNCGCPLNDLIEVGDSK